MTYTCAYAHAREHACTHTYTDRHSQMPHRRSASRTRTLSLCRCQIKAWKAGHKGDCVAAARADTRTAAKPTADQMRVLKMLQHLLVLPTGGGERESLLGPCSLLMVALDASKNIRNSFPHLNPFLSGAPSVSLGHRAFIAAETPPGPQCTSQVQHHL